MVDVPDVVVVHVHEEALFEVQPNIVAIGLVTALLVEAYNG
jgi:hypothetical protein